MKFSLTSLVILLLCCFLGACNNASEGDQQAKTSKTATEAVQALPTTKEGLVKAIKAAENALSDKENKGVFNKGQAMATIKAYEKYAELFADDTQTPEYLFKAAEIYRSIRNFNKAISIYENIDKNYTKYDKHAQSLFLLGFTYENDLKNLDKAKRLYEEFLQKYPEHELAEASQFSLKNLGKSPEDIVKSFEKK